MTIFVSGSIARDIIMDFPGRFAEHIDPRKIHVLSLSFAVENLKENYGGTAANIAYNLAMLGVPVRLLGRVGRDGRDFLKRYKYMSIDIKLSRISDNALTAAAYIITDRDDNQITGFHAGAMNEPTRLPKVKVGDWAIIAPENPKNMVRLARHYQKNRVNYIFDPGQQITALRKSELAAGIKGAKFLIGNDYEIGIIEKRLTPSLSPPSLSPFGRSLRREREKGGGSFSPVIRGRVRGGRLILVRTLGPKGSEILHSGRKIKIGIAKPRRVLDPTGAGDAYRAGFLKGLILGYDLRRCGQLGATVASFAVEKYGTQEHRFTWQAILKRHNLNFQNKTKKL